MHAYTSYAMMAFELTHMHKTELLKARKKKKKNFTFNFILTLPCDHRTKSHIRRTLSDVAFLESLNKKLHRPDTNRDYPEKKEKKIHRAYTNTTALHRC